MNNVLCPNDAISSTSSALAYVMNVNGKITGQLKEMLQDEYDKNIKVREEIIASGELDPEHVKEIRPVPKHLHSKEMVCERINKVIFILVE